LINKEASDWKGVFELPQSKATEL